MKRWISSAVVYQINLRSFAAREPRNPVEALREKPVTESPLCFVTKNLPYIRRLGANVVYLMPPYPIGAEGRKGIGSPYSIRDFCAVEPEYGTLEDLKDLVRRAHAIGLRVILDITPNHTSRDNRWIAEHPDYYVKRPDGTIFYDCDWSDTAKLDYRSPSLREAMVGVYDFWLRLLGAGKDGQPDGIDGFRLDMAHFINDKGFWNEAMPRLRAAHPERELLFLAECYGTGNNMDLFARGIDAAYDDDFYKVCQYGYAVAGDGSTVVSLSPEAAGNGDFRDKLAAFEQGGIAGAMARALLNYEEAYPAPREAPRLARYTDNHDEGRGTYRFGNGGVRAAMLTAFLSGHAIPFLLAGQEFGALNRPPIHERIAACGKGRRMVQAGATVEQSGIEFEGNVFARDPAERRAWFEFYRELIALRKSTRELREGSFALLDAGEEGQASQRTVLAFERKIGRNAVRCAINLGQEARTLARAGTFAGRALYGQLQDNRLPAFSAIVTRTDS
jgi:glycosidase